MMMLKWALFDKLMCYTLKEPENEHFYTSKDAAECETLLYSTKHLSKEPVGLAELNLQF